MRARVCLCTRVIAVGGPLKGVARGYVTLPATLATARTIPPFLGHPRAEEDGKFDCR